jgi:hypothetical protein
LLRSQQQQQQQQQQPPPPPPTSPQRPRAHCPRALLQLTRSVRSRRLRLRVCEQRLRL